MKKEKILSVAAIFVMVLVLLSSCTVPEGSNKDNTTTDLHTGAFEGDSTTELTTAAGVSKKDKVIALSFDDGPRASTTNQILDMLSENNATATFFVVGYNIESNTETIKRAIDMGCEIGNHTMDHKILTKCKPDTIRSQLAQVNELVEKNCGYTPSLCRSPGGAYKGTTDYIDMPIILWSIDTEDWKHKDKANLNRTEEQRNEELNKIAEDVFASVGRGDIILMHDIYDFTVDLCKILIPGLVERGYKIVSVSELFDIYGFPLNKGEVYLNCKFTADPASVTVGDYIVTTNDSNLNLRSEPNTNGDILAQVPNGTPVHVDEVSNGWAKTTYEGHVGWLSAKYLLPNE